MKPENLKIEVIFARIVDIIRSGKGDIDSCLAEFPDYAEELRPLLELALWLEGRKAQFDPRRDFVSASRKRLVAIIKRSVTESLKR